MELAKARTEEDVHIHLLDIREKVGTDQEEWWFSRKHQYATYCFLEKGVKRYTKTLSNGCMKARDVNVKGLEVN